MKKTVPKPLPQWFLALETAFSQIYSTVNYYTVRKINSQAYISKTYHERKPLPLRNFVHRRNFSQNNFSDKLKPLRIGPYKLVLDRRSDVTHELLSQDGSTFHTHRNHLIPYYPKKPLLYPHLRNLSVFRSPFKIIFQNPINKQIMTLLRLTQMIHFPMIHLHKKISLHHYLVNHQNLSFKITQLLMTQDFNQLQKLINPIPLLEHVIILKMTYQSTKIPPFD